MNDKLKQILLDTSIKEFQEKSLGSTEQYLDVFEIESENGKPIIANIQEDKNNSLAVYFPIKGEPFFYTHFYQIEPIKLIGDTISPAHRVYLSVISEINSLEKILQLTKIIPTSTWQKDEQWSISGKSHPSRKYQNSGFEFELDKNEAGIFESKILNLLIELEKHKSDLINLKETCDLCIRTYWSCYYGNSMLGGFSLDSRIIEKLNQLNLWIDFDLYTSGKAFN